MIVRIRFRRGTNVARRSARTSRAALVLSTFGTLAAISCATFGIWRLGQDLGWAGDFVFSSGLLSHWQVWLTAAGALQYGSWRLARFGRSVQARQMGKATASGAAEHIQAAVNS